MPKLPLRIMSVRPGFLKIPFCGKHLAWYFLKKRIPQEALTRHGYIVAKTGSGKSELLKLLLLILKVSWRWTSLRFRTRSDRSVILLDPHGDVTSEIARQSVFASDLERAKGEGRSPDLVLISPMLSKAHIASLNPFDLMGKEYNERQLEVIAQYLTGAFSAMLGKGDIHLTLSMRTILTPLFLVLLTMAQERSVTPTFLDVERFLDDERNSDLIEYGRTRLPGKGQRSFFETLFLDGRFTSTKFALRVRLASLITSQLFVELLCHERSTWDLETLMNSGKTILIDASKSYLGEHVSEIYGRTITALVQSYAFLRSDQTTRMPTYFIIDESASFISEDIKTILTESRKFGLHLLLVNQIVKQGGASQEFHDTIMGNTALKIVGNAGEATRRTMARECDTDSEHFRGLRVGTFVVSSDVAEPFILKLPTYWLGNKACMPPKDWEKLRNELLLRYYRPIAVPNIPTTTAPKKAITVPLPKLQIGTPRPPISFLLP